MFPPGYFDREDPSPDASFYGPPRLVTHIDDRAIAAVGALYAEHGVDGEVLDLCSSWISHCTTPPRRLVGLGMNAAEPAAGFGEVRGRRRTPPGPGDPLYAVWATRR